jgi:hypothetical protein
MATRPRRLVSIRSRTSTRAIVCTALGRCSANTRSRAPIQNAKPDREIAQGGTASRAGRAGDGDDDKNPSAASGATSPMTTAPPAEKFTSWAGPPCILSKITLQNSPGIRFRSPSRERGQGRAAPIDFQTERADRVAVGPSRAVDAGGRAGGFLRGGHHRRQRHRAAAVACRAVRKPEPALGTSASVARSLGMMETPERPRA